MATEYVPFTVKDAKKKWFPRLPVDEPFAVHTPSTVVDPLTEMSFDRLLDGPAIDQVTPLPMFRSPFMVRADPPVVAPVLHEPELLSNAKLPNVLPESEILGVSVELPR